MLRVVAARRRYRINYALKFFLNGDILKIYKSDGKGLSRDKNKMSVL